jgi:hypothetical protein
VPSLSPSAWSEPQGIEGPAVGRIQPVKKLLILAILVGLGLIAAKRLREA